MKSIKLHRKSLAIAAAFTTALILNSTPVHSQPEYGNPTGAEQGGPPAGAQQYAPPAAEQPAQNFDDQTLQKFAAATVELSKIREDFARKLEGVQDQNKAMEIQQEAQTDMVNAVTKKGLEPDTYNSIARQMGTDRELAQKVNQLISVQEGR